MRPTIPVIAFLIVAAIAVGCKSTDDKPALGPKQSETVAQQLDKAKTEAKEAAQAMQDYAYAQKAEFVDKMKRELADIRDELDQLSAKVDRSSGAAKADAKIKLEAVREKWTQAKNQLDQAEGATESTWDDVKGGFKKMYAELKESFENTRQWLSDKVEP
jgi:molecular chaperone GrpE (heat shock protein)